VFEKQIRKNEIQDQEEAERLEKYPDRSQPGTLVTHLQIGFGQHPDGIPVVQLFLVKHMVHK